MAKFASIIRKFQEQSHKRVHISEPYNIKIKIKVKKKKNLSVKKRSYMYISIKYICIYFYLD